MFELTLDEDRRLRSQNVTLKQGQHSKYGAMAFTELGVAVCLSIACLGFLPLNMPKARVFMGDIGSILLGSVFAGLIWMAAESVLDFVCMAAFLFPFYVDELVTVLVRLKAGFNPSPVTHCPSPAVYIVLV